MGGSSVLNTLPTEHFTSDTVVTKCVQAFPTLSNSAQPAGWLVHACVLNHFSRVQLCVAPWTLWPTRLLCPWILQARVLEWVAVPSSRGSSQLKDRIRISYSLLHWQTDCLPLELPGKPNEEACIYTEVYKQRIL